TSSPAGCSSHCHSTPVASSTRRVASTSSGPVPSPGMRVTSWAMVSPLSSGSLGRAMLSPPVPPADARGSVHHMSIAPPRQTQATHEVVNQAPPLQGYNALEANRPLAEALDREGGGWARDRVDTFAVLR